jgi:hypothetical protein
LSHGGRSPASLSHYALAAAYSQFFYFKPRSHFLFYLQRGHQSR